MCAAVFRPVCGSDGRTYSKLCNMINIVHVGVPLLMSGPALGGAGPSRPRLQVNLHQGLYLYVLDKPTVDYTLARGPLRRGAQLRAIRTIILRPALACVIFLQCVMLVISAKYYPANS